MFPYLIAAVAFAAVAIAFGVSITTLLPFAIVLVCPLMMLVMMRGMHGREDHTGHGCEHDPTRSVDVPAGHRH
jgi:hypothetical protein